MSNAQSNQDGKPIIHRHGRRWIALAVTAGLLIVPSLLFTMLFRIPSGDKPLFFFQMLAGPYAGTFSETTFGFHFGTAVWVTVSTAPYIVNPRWFTLPPTLLGITCWLGCGVSAATGGV